MSIFQTILPQLFEEFVNRTEAHPQGCLLWKGKVVENTQYAGGTVAGGYGKLCFPDGRNMQAHRLAYELFIGPVPEGLVIDHLCRNRACVNPEHLEAVTHKENSRRGAGRGGVLYKGGCQDPTHTPIREPSGHARCLECNREYQRKKQKEWREANRERFNENRRRWREKRRAEGKRPS